MFLRAIHVIDVTLIFILLIKGYHNDVYKIVKIMVNSK